MPDAPVSTDSILELGSAGAEAHIADDIVAVVDRSSGFPAEPIWAYLSVRRSAGKRGLGARNSQGDQRREIVKSDFALRYTDDEIVHFVLIEPYVHIIDSEKVQGCDEPSSLVAVEERMIAYNKETVCGSFFDECGEALDVKDEHLWLGETGIQSTLITNTLRPTVLPDQGVMNVKQIVP